MRLLSRTDSTLVAALFASTVMLFYRPLGSLFDLVAEVEARYQLDLVPALIILVVAMFVHRIQKREQVKSAMLQVRSEVDLAQNRMSEMSRLVSLGQALTHVLDRTNLELVLQREMPAFVGQRDCWVLQANSDQWDPLYEPPVGSETLILAHANIKAAQLPGPLQDKALTFEQDGYLAVPISHGGHTIGLTVVRQEPAVTPAEIQTLAAGAALLGGAINTVQLVSELREQSTTDKLTGCVNRTHALAGLENEMRRARRSRASLAVIMFDLDHFKAINDGRGHLAGDMVLEAVGSCLQRILRRTDIICRYGGDEFLLVLPDTQLMGAMHVAESVRREVAGLEVLVKGETLTVTASIGLTGVVTGESNVKAVVARADDALYQAKRAGRGRVELIEAPTVSTAEVAHENGLRQSDTPSGEPAGKAAGNSYDLKTH